MGQGISNLLIDLATLAYSSPRRSGVDDISACVKKITYWLKLKWLAENIQSQNLCQVTNIFLRGIRLTGDYIVGQSEAFVLQHTCMIIQKLRFGVIGRSKSHLLVTGVTIMYLFQNSHLFSILQRWSKPTIWLFESSFLCCLKNIFIIRNALEET